MKIAVIGTGYVGLVSGTCFSTMGNDIYCVDVDEQKIQKLKEGIIPIYEPGLSALVVKNHEQGNLRFTTDITEALDACNICFIAVGTPPGEDGSADLHYVLDVAASIGKNMKHHMYIVDKSTVPVGTASRVRERVQQELDARNSDLTFDVISNPEFLKEGNAVSDCMKPDRIIIGVDNEDAAEVMRELYQPYVMDTGNFIIMDIASAEMTKYAANCMLATKISFMNEIANICEKVGADVNMVRKGIGSDKRIGYSFIYPGCGYGGSCFPKDVKALIHTATENGYDSRILKAVEDVNQSQKSVMATKAISYFGGDVKGKVFAIWGLAFKPETDDMREAAACTIIKELTEAGASVRCYDPKAMDEAKRIYLKDIGNITYCKSKYEALEGADALMLVTEWKEFRSPDFEHIGNTLKTSVIFDGRNQYNSRSLARYGIDYVQIGVSNPKTS